jgi:hypothetical protein
MINKGVIQVKDITRYTVVSYVSKNSDNKLVLSQLKEFSELNQEPTFVTRDYWANKLQINRKTIQRWELEIINSKPKFAYLYYDGNKRKSKSKLDLYQRFFLSLIYSLKEGLVTGFVMTNQDVISYLEAKEGNKPRWMGLTRQEFQKWNEHQQYSQAS